MILLINSETSNIGSWISILNKLNQSFVLSNNKSWNTEDITKIIFPGIGNFEQVAKNILKNDLKKKLIYLIKKNIPYLGVCIGMQILFKKSQESINSNYEGLDIINGEVLKISEKNILTPHNGWNDIEILNKSNIFANIKTGTDFYFNHSFWCKCNVKSIITSVLKDNKKITSSFQQNSIYGIQFHPEKSMEYGLKIIKNFINAKC